VSAELSEITPGVLRLTWSTTLQASGLGPATEEVRRTVEAAFAEGHHRIETLIDPDDQSAQRIATFSGLLREGVARGVAQGADRIVYARLAGDTPVEEPVGFQSLLNSFLPRKRAIGQMLIRDTDRRVLMCQLTYKQDHDLPGGVVEVGESPREATAREVTEELGLEIPAGPLLLTDWLPPWGGWDDAVCLVFDGGVHDASLTERIIRQTREIKSVEFRSLVEIDQLSADFTARRIRAALIHLDNGASNTAYTAYTESGR
jgi:8-oxo-dGTP pyrophosphatase MutT (NUDIX family)